MTIVVNIKRIWEVYSAVRALGGRATSRRIAEILGVSERTVQRYLKILLENEYVEAIRVGMRIYYRVVKPLTEEEAKRLVVRGGRADAPVYQLARSINDIIKEGGFHADLIGAAKIHLLVPTHSRITHDVDVIVAREHTSMLVASLKYGLGLIPEKSGGVHADHRFRHPVEDIKINVIIDGFKEEGVVVWNLAPILRRGGGLTLEHAVIAKLTRRSFDERTDAYDVAVSLPHLNIDRFIGIYMGLRKENPTLATRVPRHLELVGQYVLREYTGVDLEIISRSLQKVKERIEYMEKSRRT